MEEGSGDPSPNAVIIVVANQEAEKAVVVESLTRGGGWEARETAAGVRILTHTGSGAQVVDTLPLRNVQGRSPMALSRRWISQNSLRRIVLGKAVLMVSVLTDAIFDEPCNKRVLCSENCWLEILEQIWRNDDAIVTVALTESVDSSSRAKEQQQRIEKCLRRHSIMSKRVLVSNLRSAASAATLGESIQAMCPALGLANGAMGAFEAGGSSHSWCGVQLGLQSGRERRRPWSTGGETVLGLGRKRFGPWSPERVILFGRTGSGKSTLAQMLTLGKLDHGGSHFRASSGVRGGTEGMESGEGRGWYVVDTPGFGEPDSGDSTVPTLLAQHKLKHFVECKEGAFSHHLFVLRKDRIDRLEVSLWKFFKLLFALGGKQITNHLSIVISNADQDWLDENRSYLQQTFEGCSSFLTAEFPPNDADDAEAEGVYEQVRADSLRTLEEGLAQLGRFDLASDFGKKSRMAILNERDRGLNDEKVDAAFAAVADILEALGYLGKNPFIPGLGLGFVSFFTSIDIFIHRLTRMTIKDPINLESVDC